MDEKVEALGLNLAELCHELRTPLTALLGNLGLLAEEIGDPDRAHRLRLAIAAAEQALGILNREVAAAGDLPRAPVTLVALLGHSLALFAPQAAARRIALRLDLEAAGGLEDESLGPRAAQYLRQVLDNVVANALRATERGEIRVRLEGAARRLVVEDTGPGFTASDLQAAADAAPARPTARPGGGAGLGLKLCRRFVEGWGGTLELTHARGGGARVAFTLPPRAAVPTHAAPRPEPCPEPCPEPPAEPRSVAALRILLVEDNAINRELITALLRRDLHRVDSVADGPAAIEAARAGSYDLVLMDVQLPKLSGLDATRAIRALPGNAARVPIIALTAHALRGDREKCHAAGMTGFVAKPVDMEKLRLAIRAAVTGRAAA